METQEKDTTNKNIIKEGDAVILYEDISTSSIVKMTSNGYLDNRFGRFLHRDIIGKPFGSRINSKKGYIHALKPTPTLITQSLPHRTQILYTADISMILLKLNIQPGSKVVETGTGSGSLSCSFATTVQPTGHLYTYEFNQDRFMKVQDEFKTLGFNNITVVWRDTCAFGFKPREGDNFVLPSIDAVFLDLPKPWEAIPHANEVLKRGGRICCFSPCIEQVQKNCLQLEKDNFADIRTFEFIIRNFEKKKNPFKSLNDNLINRKRTRKELDNPNPDDIKFKEVQAQLVEGAKEEPKKEAPENDDKEEFYYTSGAQTSQGHTGYLTFAIKP